MASNNLKGKLKNWKLFNSKVLPKFGFTIPALKVIFEFILLFDTNIKKLKVMDAERRPHPNCGIPPEEIDFMQNIILGKITSKY